MYDAADDGIDLTMQFKRVGDLQEVTPEQVILSVYDALSEKGYEPIGQMVGYLLSGEPAYIPRHNNARATIGRKGRDELLEEMIRAYIRSHGRTTNDDK